MRNKCNNSFHSTGKYSCALKQNSFSKASRPKQHEEVIVIVIKTVAFIHDDDRINRKNILLAASVMKTLNEYENLI